MTNERFGGLAASTWDSLAGRHFYSSAAWLGFCATDFGRESGAAVYHRDGEPVCAVPYVAADESLFSSYRWHDVLTAQGLPAPAPDGLLVGPREGYQTHLLGASRTTPDELADVVRQLRKAAAEVDPAGHTCVAMYLGTEDVLALWRAGVTTTPVLLETDAWIELPEGGWPEWEAGLSRNNRSTVRRDVRRFRDAGYRIEQVPMTECWDRLGALASGTQAKYGHATSADIELSSLRNHALCMGEAARTALLTAPDGAVVGFCLYYVWHDTLTLRWLGFDYDRLRLTNAGEYFNLCYYDNVERAGELGVRWLHAGVQSADAKVRRGARLRPLWLLDLTEDSALAGADEAIRAHNAGRHAELKSNPVTAKAVDDSAWEPFL